MQMFRASRPLRGVWLPGAGDEDRGAHVGLRAVKGEDDASRQPEASVVSRGAEEVIGANGGFAGHQRATAVRLTA